MHDGVARSYSFTVSTFTRAIILTIGGICSPIGYTIELMIVSLQASKVTVMDERGICAYPWAAIGNPLKHICRKRRTRSTNELFRLITLHTNDRQQRADVTERRSDVYFEETCRR